jgi:hypothetical protein
VSASISTLLCLHGQSNCALALTYIVTLAHTHVLNHPQIPARLRHLSIYPHIRIWSYIHRRANAQTRILAARYKWRFTHPHSQNQMHLMIPACSHIWARKETQPRINAVVHAKILNTRLNMPAPTHTQTRIHARVLHTKTSESASA